MYEAKLYRIFADEHCVGIPSLHWRGVAGDSSVIVIDLLGPSLQECFRTCGWKFSLKTVLMLADQMLSRLEYLHGHYFLHRDLKPENFLMGRGESASIVHIIDFGFAKKYRSKDMLHIPYTEGKGMVGTARYASLNTHRGIQQGRRDDLESLGYIFLFFLKGCLPWQNLLPSSHSSKQKEIAYCKMTTPIETLCADAPIEFATYIDYCRGLGFEAEPDYGYVRQLFRDLYIRQGYKSDDKFDWMVDGIRHSISGTLGFNDAETSQRQCTSTHLTSGPDSGVEMRDESS
jgi:serine/threonine protein kinase